MQYKFHEEWHRQHIENLDKTYKTVKDKLERTMLSNIQKIKGRTRSPHDTEPQGNQNHHHQTMDDSAFDLTTFKMKKFMNIKPKTVSHFPERNMRLRQHQQQHDHHNGDHIYDSHDEEQQHNHQHSSHHNQHQNNNHNHYDLTKTQEIPRGHPARLPAMNMMSSTLPIMK